MSKKMVERNRLEVHEIDLKVDWKLCTICG